MQIVQAVCPKCNTLNPAANKYCGNCGESLSSARMVQDVTSPQEEVTYYSDGAITVSSTRAVLGGKTYAMANITSVSMGEKPANRAPAIFIVLLGAMGVLLAGMGLFDNGSAWYAIGGVLMALGIILAVAAKGQYMVRIGSASGEADALVSQSKGHIAEIVDAMNQAIVERG
jgi:hypothetical protein